MPGPNGITIDEHHPLLDTRGMFHKEFPSDIRQLRYFTLLIVQKAPREFHEVNLLEQQIGEIIKNAIEHGNGGDRAKTVDVWYAFEEHAARLVVQDKGPGFQEVERWNAFLKERNEWFGQQNLDRMAEFVSFRTGNSHDPDSGNALLAAVEYWNAGIAVNDLRNKFGLKRIFPHRQPGILLGHR